MDILAVIKGWFTCHFQDLSCAVYRQLSIKVELNSEKAFEKNLTMR